MPASGRGVLDYFIANRKNDFISMVRHSSLDDESRHKLFISNSMGLWQSSAPFSRIKHKIVIDEDALQLARWIFKHILSRHRNPSFKYVTMALDNKVAVISEKVSDKATAFDYWIKLSTTEKGIALHIPLSRNRWYDSMASLRSYDVRHTRSG